MSTTTQLDRRRLLTLEEAAERSTTPAATLRYYRHLGRGPKSVKLGRRVLYPEADLEAWIEQRIAETAVGEEITTPHTVPAEAAHVCPNCGGTQISAVK